MTTMLQDLLDWSTIMSASRTAGGHREIMDSLFSNNGQVLASHIESDYQGSLGYVYLVHGWTEFAKIVIITDSFGSCSGCDAWEDASNESVRNMCIAMANNARCFDCIEEALDFLKELVDGDDSVKSDHWHFQGVAGPLAQELEKTLSTVQKKGL